MTTKATYETVKVLCKKLFELAFEIDPKMIASVILLPGDDGWMVVVTGLEQPSMTALYWLPDNEQALRHLLGYMDPMEFLDKMREYGLKPCQMFSRLNDEFRMDSFSHPVTDGLK